MARIRSNTVRYRLAQYCLPQFANSIRVPPAQRLGGVLVGRFCGCRRSDSFIRAYQFLQVIIGSGARMEYLPFSGIDPGRH